MVANKDDEQQQQQQDRNGSETTCPSTTATSTTINKENKNDLATSSLFCYGGDFAGLSATFSATTGHVIAVPEYMVPDVMLEWGQQPVALEVLVSEDLNFFGSNDDVVNDASTQPPEETTTASTSTSTLVASSITPTPATTITRHTVTIVPEVGCGIDNLDTMKSVNVINMTNNLDVFGNNNDSIVVALHYPLLSSSTTTSRTTTTAKTTRVETTFRLMDNKHRMRVMVDILFEQQHGTRPNSSIIKTPIVLVFERQTSKTSTSGTIANDGGLDARTVSTLLGETLSKGQPFAQDDPVSWDSNGKDDDDTVSLKLPGNITVSYKTDNDDTSSSSLVLKVGHVVNNGSSRHVVTRRFNKDGTLEDIQYSTETKAT